MITSKEIFHLMCALTKARRAHNNEAVNELETEIRKILTITQKTTK